MSQAKVDKHKQEKYNRKKAPKKSRIKEYLGYVAATVVAIALIVYIGYSVGVQFNIIKPEETTSAYVSNVTAEELASQLDSSGDYLGFYDKAKSENATDASKDVAEEATKEEATTEKATKEDTKKADK